MKDVISLVKEEFFRSFKIIKENGLYIFLPMLTDLLFIFAYGFITSPIFTKIIEYFYKSASLVTQASGNIDALAKTPSLWGVIESAGAASYTKSFILLLLIALAAVYIIYCFFMGISWCFCYRMAGKKHDFTDFVINFAKVNLFWLILFVIYFIASFVFDFVTTLAQVRADQIVDKRSIVLSIFLLLIVYFANISYSLIEKQKTWETIKKAFIIGIKKAKFTIPAFAVVIIVFFLINYLLAALSDPTSIILIGAITVLPAFTWGRIFILSVVHRL